jgi:predicted methyltransferase
VSGRTGPASAALLLAATLTWSDAAPAGQARPGLRFPPPDRPVAGIISPEYSDERTRDRHREAERVMDRLGIKAGLRVADVGAGLGYYTVRLARRLGPSAAIYAQDVSREYLDRLAARLERDRVRGVTLVHGTPGDPKLPPASVDVAILSHMYHLPAGKAASNVTQPARRRWRDRSTAPFIQQGRVRPLPC